MRRSTGMGIIPGWGGTSGETEGTKKPPGKLSGLRQAGGRPTAGKSTDNGGFGCCSLASGSHGSHKSPAGSYR